MIQEPYLLANLPEVPLSGGGRVLAADVHSCARSKKRKRSELALVIDGQGVNLYDIHSSKLVTSYAVSPLTTFTCPPCSIRCQRTTMSPSRRLTYCSTTSPKATLQCFQQGTSQDYDLSTSSLDIRKPSSPIVCLDTFVGNGSVHEPSQISLLAVHEDGEVRCYSERLDRELWSTRISTTTENHSSAEGLRVENACPMRLDQAQQALLRGREDVLATLAGANYQNNAAMLALFTRPSAGKDKPLSLKVMKIGGLNENNEAVSGRRRNPLHEIAESTIPEPGRLKKEKTRLSFHSSSGTLYQSSSNSLVVYEILGMVPHLTHDTKLCLDNIASCLRISPSLVMVGTASSVSIIDAKYSSFQGQCSLDKPLQAENSLSSKQKQKHGTAPSSVQLLSYFAPLDIVVALHGRHLIGFQLTTSAVRGTGSRKRKRDVLLIDSIGRRSVSAKKMKARPVSAKGPCSFGQPLIEMHSDDNWDKKKTLLDQYFANGEQDSIERIMEPELQAEELRQNHGRSVYSTARPAGSTGSSLDRRKIDYLLSKGFLVEDDHSYASQNGETPQKSLRIYNLPQRICNWLIQGSHLSTHLVEVALRRKGLLAAHERLRSGAVFEALAQQDPSLGAMLRLLQSAVPLTAAETVCALRHAIRQYRESNPADTVKLLTYGQLASHHRSDKESVSIARNQNAELRDSHASSDTQADRSSIAREILLTAIRRLYKYSPHSTSKALKQMLSILELHPLLDLLRMELARNGWLASYLDDRVQSSAGGPPDATQVYVIANIFNCTIDSIGSGGWISRSSLVDGLTEAVETIGHMKVEISAATEGIMEATYLKGMLGEMLLCGKNFGSIKPKASHQLTSKVPVYRTPSNIVPLGSREADVLPLGLKASQTISTHKVGAGGELIKRSARDIGRLKSKMVPKYSFERIFI